MAKQYRELTYAESIALDNHREQYRGRYSPTLGREGYRPWDHSDYPSLNEAKAER